MRIAHWQLNPRVERFLIANPAARAAIREMVRTGCNRHRFEGTHETVVLERLEPTPSVESDDAGRRHVPTPRSPIDGSA
jgi:hypothetical protein